MIYALKEQSSENKSYIDNLYLPDMIKRLKLQGNCVKIGKGLFVFERNKQAMQTNYNSDYNKTQIVVNSKCKRCTIKYK